MKMKKREKKEGGGWVQGGRGAWVLWGCHLIPITLDQHESFQFFITCKRTNYAKNDTHYANLRKKRQESSKRNYCMISLKVVMNAIVLMNPS